MLSIVCRLTAGTSARRHGGTELCSILNRAVREDGPNATVHAAVFANAINMLLVEDRAPQDWLQKLFQKSYPYVIGLVVRAHLHNKCNIYPREVC